MKPWLWLRVAAVLQALVIVGHNLATLSTKPWHGAKEQAVFDAMRGFQFNIMGAMRSTWDFYRGLSILDDGDVGADGCAALASQQHEPQST